jgi:Asp-tRNA(Asn)/Glu-tRNA(Gln) amidotransferase A subunit family amidase
LVDATIGEAQQATANGQISCVDLVQAYFARIKPLAALAYPSQPAFLVRRQLFPMRVKSTR